MKRALIGLCAALGVLLAGLSACADEALLLTRDFSSRYAAQGGWITVSYTLRNVSQKTVRGVELSDPLLGENQPAPVSRLAPGESRVVTLRARVMKDAESEPEARYTLNGVEETVTAPPETVFVETAALSAALTFYSRETTTVVLTVRNDGNAPVYGVKATDDVLGDMGEAVSRLDPGECAEWSRAALSRGAAYRCVVTATGSGGGMISTVSNELTETQKNPAPPEAGPVSLSAGLSDGRLVLTLSNPGPEALRSVTLRERNGRSQRTLAFVPAQGSASMTWPRAWETGEALTFEAVSPEGGLLAEISFIAPDTPEDAGQAADDLLAALDGPSLRMNDPSRTYRAMIAAAVAALAATLIVWQVFHRRRRRQARRARRRMRKKKQQQGKRNGEKTA